MAEEKDAHIVEIPVDVDHHQKLMPANSTAVGFISSAIREHHPLAEISRSPGHFLLLKLWQREEDICGRRLVMKELRMDSIKQEIFQLCCFFFIFHGFFLTVLFTASSSGDHYSVCRKCWIPLISSLCSSLVIIFLVQLKLRNYWKVDRHLQMARADGRTLTRCIQELKMKGASFDLCKEPHNGKRLKSSSVEIKWKPITWCAQYYLTVCLVCFTGLVLSASRVILCY